MFQFSFFPLGLFWFSTNSGLTSSNEGGASPARDHTQAGQGDTQARDERISGALICLGVAIVAWLAFFDA